MKKLIVPILCVLGIFLVVEGQQSPQTTPQQVVITQPPPTGAVNVTVTNVGAKGARYLCYWVVTVYPIGMSYPATPVCTSTANVTLTGGNYNRVTWQRPPGGAPTGYWVIRGTTNSFPGTATDAVNTTVLASSVFAQNDQSNTLHAFTFLSAPNANAVFTIDNSGAATPVLNLKINGVTASSWNGGGGGGLAFSSISSGTNATTLTMGTGGVLATSGSGTINANLLNGGIVPTNFAVTNTASAVNHVQATGGIATSAPVVSAVGTDTDIDINLVGKGQGLAKVNNATYTFTGTLSIASLNTGATVIPAIVGRTYRIVGFYLQAIGGSFATCTGVDIADTSAVVAIAVPTAGLTQNTVVNATTANITFTKFAWLGPIAANLGVELLGHGGSCATATSLNYSLSVELN